MDLVTGGAGFLGSHLVDRLRRSGRSVRVLDWCRGAPGDPPHRQEAALRAWGDTVDVRRDDLRDRQALRDALDEVERVFHLAARSGVRQSLEEPELYEEINVRGTRILLEEMERAGVPRLVFTSSSSVYGSRPDPARETDPLDPCSPYAATKVAAERAIAAWHRPGRHAVVLRPFSVYGPRQRANMAIRRFITCALDGEPLPCFGDGESSRDYTYVDDVVEALCRATDLTGHHVLNVGAGTRTTLRELIIHIGNSADCKPLIRRLNARAGDVRHTCADSSALRATLDWVPQVGLEQGLRRTVLWIRANPMHVRLARPKTDVQFK